MTQQAYCYLQMERDLKTALTNHEFILDYQPAYDLSLQVCTSVEVLIRWNHPQRGEISPKIFLPVAQKAGLMREIDFWVIQEAFVTFSTLKACNIAPDTLSVNITTETLFLPEFFSKLQMMIDTASIDPHCIVFEIIGAKLIEDAETAFNVITNLHKMGIKVTLDNFGTGYSSLQCFLDFNIDTLKIDQPFINNQNEKTSSFIKEVVSFSNSIELNIVVQGVETKRQKEFLVDNGITTMQGYAIAIPMSTNMLTHLLKNNFYQKSVQ